MNILVFGKNQKLKVQIYKNKNTKINLHSQNIFIRNVVK
jgi:hypothetical protein